MEKSSCGLLLQLYPDVSEVEELRSTIITNCVFNSFLSYTAIMLNIITIHAIRKTSSLPKTLKTLLLSLAVSDVGVGLSVQPFYISLLVKWAQENDPGCNTYKAFFLVTRLFSMASFFGVVAVSCRRVLSYSPSSQISGTCDLQACCCCGDLNMGDECISFFDDFVGFF